MSDIIEVTIVDAIVEVIEVVVSDPGSGGDNSLLNAHLSDTTPHPVYDEMDSLVDIFEGALT